jgi:stage III sporulation protein SpoIIIAA
LQITWEDLDSAVLVTDHPLRACLQITWEDLKAAEAAVGDFGGDNRAGVQGTLHRISAIRNRKGTVIGLTCRVGRAVTGHIDMIRDILDSALPHALTAPTRTHAP